MNAGTLFAAVSLTLVWASDAPAQSLSFMTASEWRHEPAPRKLVLAADFMRVFCVQPTMSPTKLATCLDDDLRQGPAFDSAIQCLRKLSVADY